MLSQTRSGRGYRGLFLNVFDVALSVERAIVDRVLLQPDFACRFHGHGDVKHVQK